MFDIDQSMFEKKQSMLEIKHSLFEISQSMLEMKLSMLVIRQNLDWRKNECINVATSECGGKYFNKYPLHDQAYQDACGGNKLGQSWKD